MLRILRRTILAFAASMVGIPASAQLACGERAPIVRQLASEFAERLQAIGLTADGQVIEVLVSPAGSWTMLVTHPNGQSCVIGHGSDWQSIPAIATGRTS